ncbi:AbrB/MazE/SpoVT family DNA-binding domain-containing protein [Spirosoma areae]
MKIPIRRIGNSQGVLLPRLLLQQVGIENEVDMQVVDDAIFLRPIKSNPRADWDKLFQKAIEMVINQKTTCLVVFPMILTKPNSSGKTILRFTNYNDFKSKSIKLISFK